METRIKVTHCVPVHEAPDRCSHLTGKEDHQKEEKLQQKEKKTWLQSSFIDVAFGYDL